MDTKIDYTSATPKEFPFSLLQRITNGFCRESIIGRGGYGVVYKGTLDNGVQIAVKKLHSQPGLDEDQFRNELLNLMSVKHKNIIQLVGYCSEKRERVVEHQGNLVIASVEERALCLEYMPGGTLDKHVSDESCGLDWKARYNIIKGMCYGLKYLHTGCKDPIYHLDLKPANILLDKDMLPKIGDFGLSRLLGSTETCVTNTFSGTPGYMPPEYIEGQKISPKFDVFSLGVIIIQVIAGQESYYKCSDMASQEFIDLVTENWRKRVQAETMSSEALPQVQTCLEIALRCIETKRVKRPTITEIVEELNMIDVPVTSRLFPKLDPALFYVDSKGLASADEHVQGEFAVTQPPPSANEEIKMELLPMPSEDGDVIMEPPSSSEENRKWALMVRGEPFFRRLFRMPPGYN